MNFLEAHHITKNYWKHCALDDVSINVREGRIFGLLGPNGAGKTTLIRIINRITAPDEGQVFFDGKPFSEKDIKRIGYLPEERGLYRKMPVGEQAIYLAGLKGMRKAEAKKRLREWFERFEIMSWWNRKVEELSKGMQQKVQFICTIIHDPDLFIFDEPFSGFDPVNAELLKKSILELKATGKSIIFSTHNMQSVEEICDDIALINQSRLVLEGEVNDVRNRFDKGLVKMAVATPTPLSEEELAPYDIEKRHFVGGLETLTIRRRPEQQNRTLPTLLPPNVRLVSLEELTPSMEEIFIDTVKSKGTQEEKRN